MAAGAAISAVRRARPGALARSAAAEPVDPDRLARCQRGQGHQQARVDLARGQLGAGGRRDRYPRVAQQLDACRQAALLMAFTD
ncbi:MAG TPA: hypothetical protein VNO54_16990 [Streptosporangiaceae bacterium]|nr:hypothetical protein [Streptosporangiaceae bacterium]